MLGAETLCQSDLMSWGWFGMDEVSMCICYKAEHSICAAAAKAITSSPDTWHLTVDFHVAPQAGVQRAVQPGTKESMKARRVPVVREPVMVTGSDGAFVSFVPGNT